MRRKPCAGAYVSRRNAAACRSTPTLDLMKTLRPDFVVYIVGLLPLGIFYEPLKEQTGGGAVFFGVVVLYLTALRIVGRLVSRKRKSKDA